MQPEVIRWDDPVVQHVILRQEENGVSRPASLYEAKVLARRDDRFYNTSRFRQMDAGLTNMMLKTFGKRM
jgi:hypothetical protein